MRKISGFTMFEMAAVILIIAVIIGGVLLSKNMIRNAELQTVISEYDYYTKAVGEFKDKYLALPGDMNNAEDFWGGATCPRTAPVAISAMSQITCLGNGDGMISGIVNGSYSNQEEIFLVWQHLANAGMIKGKYTGATSASGQHYTQMFPDSFYGANVPRISINGLVGITLLYIANNPSTNTTKAFASTSGHMFAVGHQDSTSSTNRITDSAGFSPAEIRGIDEKLDDGLPGSGKVRTARNSNCMKDTAAVTTLYQDSTVTDLLNTINCPIYFFPGF